MGWRQVRRKAKENNQKPVAIVQVGDTEGLS